MFLFANAIIVHSMLKHDILKNLKLVSIIILFMLCYLLSVLGFIILSMLL